MQEQLLPLHLQNKNAQLRYTKRCPDNEHATYSQWQLRVIHLSRQHRCCFGDQKTWNCWRMPMFNKTVRVWDGNYLDVHRNIPATSFPGDVIFLTLFTISGKCSHFIFPKSNRKPPVFWYFQWIKNENIDFLQYPI